MSTLELYKELLILEADDKEVQRKLDSFLTEIKDMIDWGDNDD